MTNQLTVNQKEISDKVLGRVEAMKEDGLALPKNYNPSNALQIAFLQLQDMKVNNQPLLENVTKKSVAESLLNMVLQGLSPAKNQCYFIPYKDQLQMQRSYFGTQTALKRLSGVKDIWANVIFEADNFEMTIDEKGVERFVKHETNWMNRDGQIMGAYAIIETVDEEQFLTVMTRKEIESSWSQARTKNVHNKFPQEMAKRTVINRAAKNYINTSDDSDLLVNAINETTENEYDQDVRRKDVTESPTEEKSQSLAEKFKQQRMEQPKEVEPEPVRTQEENVVDAEYEEVIEEANPQEATIEAVEEELDWNDYTVSQIKASLDKHNVEYGSHARKDELVKLAESTMNGGGVVEQPALF